MPDERVNAALSSVAAAIFLTVLKAFVSIITGSLGILSEALHSGLDLGAALTTYYAVKRSRKPADELHHYGYGKIESLSGFIEVGLLLITSAWIIYEALNRLFFGGHAVEASYFGFGVMIISIVVDISRSRLLGRVAKKYKSQALEADALHFGTDILSSSVVIVGLFFVRLGYPFADPIAALGVASFVVVTSIRLGMRTVNVLMDKAPGDVVDQIKREIKGIEGVVDFHHLRVRSSSVQTFVDMHISVESMTPFEKAHELASEVEKRIQSVIPNSDVVVHVEPVPKRDEDLLDKIREIASNIPKVLSVHDIKLHEIGGKNYLELDLEFEDTLKLKEAHYLASLFEKQVKEKMEDIAEVSIHIESVTEKPANGEIVTKDVPFIVNEARDIALNVRGVRGCHRISVKKIGKKYYLTMHCNVDGDTLLDEVHRIGSQIERSIADRFSEVAHVSVHTEPSSAKNKPTD